MTPLDAKITIREDILIIALESLFYGFYGILMLQSTYLLCHGKSNTRERRVILFVTIIMFASATTQWGLQITYLLKTLPFDSNPSLHSPHSLYRERNNLQTAFNSLSRRAFLFSDGIVVWRAWILWGKNKFVILFLSTMYFFVFACAAIDLGLGIHLQYSGKVVNDQGVAGNIRHGLILPLVIPTLCVNASATMLIAYKAWIHRQDIKTHITYDGSAGSMVEKTLALFVESGMFYCLVWVVHLLGSADLIGGRVGYNIMAAVTSQVACIYPTFVIVLVCLQRTHCDRHFTYESNLEFKPPTTSMRLGGRSTKHTQSLVLPITDNPTESSGTVSAMHMSASEKVPTKVMVEEV